MKVLVLGGTRFVGRLIVETALSRGHVVTTFNRGRTGNDADHVETVRGDREETQDLARLVSGREWDAVVDTSGYVPAVVADAARALSGRASKYVFLSTVSVYPDWPQEAVGEDSRIYDCAPDVAGTAKDEANWSAEQYGCYKAGCERAVAGLFNGQAAILRPGVILGPHENVGRLTWWLTRVAAGGRVLAPGDPQRAIQPLDVRDLAEFTMHCLEAGIAGTFNVTAPLGHETFGGMLSACVEITGSSAQFEWVEDAFLIAHGVRQWTELPLWRTYPGTWSVDAARAITSGLRCRPMTSTIADTWKWLSTGQGPAAYGRQGHHGLTPGRERHLLDQWANRSGAVGSS